MKHLMRGHLSGAAGCSALNLVCGYCYCPCYAGLLLMCSTDATGTATTATAPPPWQVPCSQVQ